MLKNLIDLGKDVKEKFDNFNNWQELIFNPKDKEELKKIENVTQVFNSSIKFESTKNNHIIIPSQYILYALTIKDFALGLKDHLDIFDNYKGKKSTNQIGDEVTKKTFDRGAFDLDIYSQSILFEPITNIDYNFQAKNLINRSAGKYTVRATSDFFGSIILKIINVPDASSEILGKLIYLLSGNRELYTYLESRFTDYLPYLVQDSKAYLFAKKTFDYLIQYDNLDKIKDFIVKNSDKSNSSIKFHNHSLTSIFKTGNRLFSKEDLMKGQELRYLPDPIHQLNNEFYYFNSEWTDRTESRLDLESLKSIIELTYPQFTINLEKKNYQLISSSLIPEEHPYNLIYFGAPGTGKSNAIDRYTTDKNSVKITFHPDTDYAAFVGSYKPMQVTEGSGITYGFVVQAFLQAYIKAWETKEDIFLIIEEMNRGNCAQIFGDIFQIIERGEDGFSKYKIDVDTEMKNHLENHYDSLVHAGGAEATKADRYISYFEGKFNKIALPNNLFIHATMNTSDQSLFPIDSAFKRRWDWEYVPIGFENTEAAHYLINIGDENYSWQSFIEAVNKKVKTITQSEDKKLGQFFIKSYDSTISEKIFKAKVLFFIWNDILKDEPQTDVNYFFRQKDSAGDVDQLPFMFSDLFSIKSTQILKDFMTYLEIPKEGE
jgi:hypothetical protein